MIRKWMMLFFIVFGILPFAVSAKSLDTAGVLRQLAGNLKNIKNCAYDYNMQVHFPNGDEDQLKGSAYLNCEKEIYYSQCDAFTIIYTVHWFYKADHRKKTLLIVNLDKDVTNKLKIEVQKQIFQSEALGSFLDSFVLKFAIIKKIKNNGGILKIKLGFPSGTTIQELDIDYNATDKKLISCNMALLQLLQVTPKGTESIKEKVKFDNFKNVTDESVYNLENFFLYKNRKLDLKKYKHYKLLPTI